MSRTVYRVERPGGHDPTWHWPERQRLLHNADRYEEEAKALLLHEKLREEYERRREERVPLSERSEERGNEPEGHSCDQKPWNCSSDRDITQL